LTPHHGNSVVGGSIRTIAFFSLRPQKAMCSLKGGFMIKVIISGIGGRMGGRILNVGKEDSELKIVAGLECPEHPLVDKEICAGIKVYSDLNKIIDQLEVLIEFTNPEVTLEHLKIVSDAGRKMVIGTTGFSPEQEEEIKKLTQNIACVKAPNMSVGVNLLFSLVGEVANVLKDYDIEIVETHHNKKKDAPSGTAKKLAQIIAQSLNRDLEKVGVYGRKGLMGVRKPEEIAIHALRAGDIVGEHTVVFAGNNERIELTHKAHSRDTFARGAIRAAKWIVNQPNGLYDMQSVLGDIL